VAFVAVDSAVPTTCNLCRTRGAEPTFPFESTLRALEPTASMPERVVVAVVLVATKLAASTRPVKWPNPVTSSCS